MWLNPLKGAHLTLGQLDKTLPVDIERTDPAVANPNEKIERGSIVYIQATGNAGTASADFEPRFALYTDAEAATPNAVPYVALMSVFDYQAGMAGNVGQAPEAQGIAKETKTSGANETFLNPTNVEGAQTFIGPRITAISLVQPAEWETNNFDAKGYGDAAADFYVGEPLTVKDGKVTHWVEGKNVIGYVTARKHVRWINDLGSTANGARISGGNAHVIAFSTAWIPAAAATTSTVTPAPLMTGAPKDEAPKATQAPAQGAQNGQAQKPGNVAK